MSDDQNIPLTGDPELSSITVERFAPEELVYCSACDRSNSPKRTTCIYCGEALAGEAPAASESSADAITGSYFLPANQLGSITEDGAGRLADLLQIKAVELQAALTAGGPLPVLGAAMIEDRPELITEIEALGVHLVPIDSEVLAKHSVRKIRTLVLTEEAVSAPPAETEDVRGWLDLVLVVVGRVIRSRIEQEESRTWADVKATGLRHLSTDESLLDLYFDGSDEGWRIYGNNFDFSCLQNEKRVTTFENVSALISIIRERAANAEIDDSFHRKRSVLANVWPLDPVSKSEWAPGIRQKYNYKTVTTSDNESQFNNYSRAAQFLRMTELKEGQ